MQEMGIACEIKRPKTKNKTKQNKTKIYIYIYRLLYENIMGNANQKTAIDTHERKNNPNTTLKIVIKPQEKRKKEERKKKDLKKQTQNN